MDWWLGRRNIEDAREEGPARQHRDADEAVIDSRDRGDSAATLNAQVSTLKSQHESQLSEKAQD